MPNDILKLIAECFRTTYPAWQMAAEKRYRAVLDPLYGGCLIIANGIQKVLGPDAEVIYCFEHHPPIGWRFRMEQIPVTAKVDFPIHAIVQFGKHFIDGSGKVYTSKAAVEKAVRQLAFGRKSTFLFLSAKDGEKLLRQQPWRFSLAKDKQASDAIAKLVKGYIEYRLSEP